MGYGLLLADDPPRALKWGVLVAKASLPLPKRLEFLYSRLKDLILELQPNEVVVEEPFVGGKVRQEPLIEAKSHQFIKSALAIGQAQAVVFIASAGQGLPIRGYPPATIKQAVTDYGAATKEQVQRMVQSLLCLDAPPTPSDAADALAVALCHWSQLGFRRTPYLLDGRRR
jgi:crossover junction endodeoxyribonuclease RuvC